MIRRSLLEARSLLAGVGGLGGMAVTDSRLTAAINYVQEELMKKLNYPTLVERVRFCNYSGLIALPLEYEAALRFIIQSTPEPIANQWYEFMGSGPGRQDGEYGWTGTPIDRGEWAVIRQPDTEDTDGGQLVRHYWFAAEDAGKTVRILGKDVNNRWIRSKENGAWVDGELLTCPDETPFYATTTQKFSEVSGVIRERTNKDTELHYIDSEDATHFAARYNYKDTNPRFRMYWCPGVVEDTDYMTVHALCRRRYRPAVDDSDLLLISDLKALRMGLMAERHEKSQEYDKAETAWALAVKALREDAFAWHGDSFNQVEREDGSGFGDPTLNWVS